MSKESRRRQRMAGQTPGSGPGASSSQGASGASGPSGANRDAAGRSGGSRPTGSRPSTSPVGTPRAGRRERARPYERASFFQRYRVIIVAAAVVAVVAIVGVGVFAAATQPAFACSSTWQPTPTASPGPDGSPQPGYVQPDMGTGHVAVGTVIKYTYCPPASGKHYDNPANGQGPIPARIYGPSDPVIPDGWVHNLEHGGLVVLYKGETVDQSALKALYDAMPPSPVCGFPVGGNSPSPVIARFDNMAWPFAAIVWDRVLPMQTLDQQAIIDFYLQYGERTNPQQLCASPGPSASPSGSPGASGSPSTAPSESPSLAPSSSGATEPSASPS